MMSLSHKEVSFHDFGEKPVFLNFWATWCAPCIAEIPTIQALYDSLQAEVAFVLLSNENEEIIRDFIEQRNYSLPVYRPVDSIDEHLNIKGIPVTYIVAPSGRIAYRHEGIAKWNTPEMRSYLRELAHDARAFNGTSR